MSYSKKVLEIFQHPENYGKIKNPDGIGKAGNIVCGDVMAIYIKIKKNQKNEEIISDIKFETFGCVAAIATSSIITTLAKGKTIKEALKIGKQNVIKKLNGLPPAKIHCSLLSTDALFEAIFNYYSKQAKTKITKEMLKRHEAIQKDQSEIKKRYKNWVDNEEKILNK
ncbi:MAG TPA: iron-sulfur cluster assembly scaffold protein [Candidatus Paceibacterota bacterium]|nr:iron-sulfur cluster assembly scaffold protein [Candidatus Paceibacterota bacterium]HRZ29578.1 iron-sulfur cluster assembly scaffold protein [Candidatus Paceibacterota bacterium]